MLRKPCKYEKNGNVKNVKNVDNMLKYRYLESTNPHMKNIIMYVENVDKKDN